MSTRPEDRGSFRRRAVALEYATLRNEILKRVEIRQQIVATTLALAGVFLGVGLSSEAVALIYPPLAMFLALSWYQNDYRISALAYYIREHLERGTPGLVYETILQKERLASGGIGSWRFVVLSHGGIFLLTQLLAIGIEVSKFTFSALEWVLLSVDLLAVLVVIWITRESGRMGKMGSHAPRHG
jgi:hypothetical protein